MQLRARVMDADAERYDIELRVGAVEPETRWTALVGLGVTGVSEVPNRRTAPRVRGEGSAPAQALTCRAIAPNEIFDVSLADISVAGLAFVTDRAVHVGDTYALMPTLEGRPMRIRARVLHVETIGSLTRVGGELTAITEVNRRRIARLAGDAPAAGG